MPTSGKGGARTKQNDRLHVRGSNTGGGGSSAAASLSQQKAPKEDEMNRNAKVGVILCLLSGCALLFAGCAETTATSPARSPLGSSEMVGSWAGSTVRTSQSGANAGSFNLNLQGDGTLNGASTLGGTLRGTWSVSNGQFTGSITTQVQNTIFSLSGTASGNTVSGKFTSSDGGSGSFEMNRR